MWWKSNVPFPLVYCLLLLLGLCISLDVVSAQTSGYSVSGIVVDVHGVPISGALVQVTEAKKMVTNKEGRFELREIPSREYILITRSVGCKEDTLKLRGNNINIRVVLYEATHKLKDLVVEVRANVNDIGIREKNGVVSRVDMHVLQRKPMLDIGMALQGLAPGLTVTPSSELGGKPEIRIRGNSSLRRGDTANEPLYVLDGKVISSDAFMLLNPLDIDEIKVLKDAVACAIYGIKAANGVLEIRSKRGRKGPITISYSTDLGIAMRGTRPLKMMDSVEKLEYERHLQNPAAPGYLLSSDYINLMEKNRGLEDVNKLYNSYFGTPLGVSKEFLLAEAQERLDSLRQSNTDWFKILMRNTFYQNHFISVRGGSDAVSYYTSAGFGQQQGQLPGNDYRKAQVRLSLDWELGILGYLSLQAGGTYGRHTSPNSSSFGLQSMLYNLNAYESPQSKLLFSYPGNRAYSDLFNQYSSYDNQYGTSASFSANVSPLKGLRIDAVVGLDLLYDDAQEVAPSTGYDQRHIGKPKWAQGRITRGKNSNITLSTNVRASYEISLRKAHHLTLTANYDYFYNNIDRLQATGHGTGRLNFISGANMGITNPNWKPSFNSYQYSYAQVGAGAAFGYSYRQLLDLFGTYKADASSVLPEQKRWNSAWALGSGLHCEGIIQQVAPWITDFVTRISYGYTANLTGITSEETIPIFSYSDRYYASDRELSMLRLYNPDLKAEQTCSLDLGLSVGIFKRHNIGLQWYQRLTTDALMDVPVAASRGYGFQKRNIGVLQNKGTEFTFSSNILNTDAWQLTLRGSLAYNNNKVISLYDRKAMYVSPDDLLPTYVEGEPYNILYGWNSLGINPATGVPMLLTPTGEEKSLSSSITRADVQQLGRSDNPYTGTISILTSYRSLELSVYFYYAFGGKLPFANTYIRDQASSYKNAPKGVLEQTWFKNGDEGKIYPTPFLSTTAYNNYILLPNSRMLANSAFLKLSQLSLRYRIPAGWLQKSTYDLIRYGSLAIQGSNLAVLTPYTDGSPEAGTVALSVQPIITLNATLTF